MTDAPTEWGLWVIKHLGETRYEMLLERKNDISIKYSKAEMEEQAEHYRGEYYKMVQDRMKGAVGYLSMVAYD